MASASTQRPASGGTTTAEMVDLYRLMLLIRRFEESLYRKYREGKIGGYLHRYDGQEALVAGVIPLAKHGDYVLPSYRDHAHALACGVEPRYVMAELLGKATGCAGGKGGSMHLSGVEHGFLGGDGIVGGPVPISVGVGYALRYQETDNLCICYFGDGALNQGGVHEALNMAALFRVPVLFVLENNGYAMGTSVSRSTAQAELFRKAEAHGIPADRIDGMDVLTVRDTAQRAMAAIRAGEGPRFLEIQCYRFVGHGIADNAQQQRFYRTEEEVERWKMRDPIAMLWHHIVEAGAMSTEEAEVIDRTIRDLIDEAVRYAEASPEPPLDSLYEHVFA